MMNYVFVWSKGDLRFYKIYINEIFEALFVLFLIFFFKMYIYICDYMNI